MWGSGSGRGGEGRGGIRAGHGGYPAMASEVACLFLGSEMQRSSKHRIMCCHEERLHTAVVAEGENVEEGLAHGEQELM